MGIIDRDGFGRRGRSRDAVYSWEFRNCTDGVDGDRGEGTEY